MIERKFVAQKIKEFQIQEFIEQNLKKVGHSHTKLVKTPLGEKIVVYASRPGLVVGRKGENIKRLTKILKRKFELENPQIEISEIENPNLDAQIVAERIANSLERFGTQKFKGVGHKTMSDVMSAGALGVEIIISGKIPSARAKSWRFYQGYLKKCGEPSLQVRKAITQAQLKAGTVGIQVSIMPPDAVLPDRIKVIKGVEAEEAKAEPSAEKKEERKAEEKEKKKEPKKRTRAPKKEAKEEKKEEGQTE